MLIDLHVHTTISPCSDLYLDDLLCYAQTRNLDGVCITDHQTMTVSNQIHEGEQNNGLVVLIGQEYEPPQGGEVAPKHKGLSGQEVRRLLRENKDLTPYVPASVARLLEQWRIRDRLQKVW